MPLLNTSLAILITLTILTIPLLTARILSILPSRRPKPRPRKRLSRSDGGGAKGSEKTTTTTTTTHLLIVLGSGGHTAEMISMLRNSVTKGDLNWDDYTKRTWIVSSGDDFSAEFARRFEEDIQRLKDESSLSSSSLGENQKEGKEEEEDKKESDHHYEILEVPRARRIHQSLLSTPFSCLMCFKTCLHVLLRSSSSYSEDHHHHHHHHHQGYPDLILTNGPATATILIFASLFLRFLDWRGANSEGKMRTVFVESWARVRRLSLSGRLLGWCVDRVVVQWESLRGAAGGRAEYLGVLV